MTGLVAQDRVAFDEVLADIEAQRSVVERHLATPAKWRGPLRRELRGREALSDRQRYASAFDDLADSPKASPLDISLVLRLHDKLVSGETFRERGVRVGRYDSFPPAAEISARVADACAQAMQESEVPVLRAARLHLAICRIHPFVDGNGRVARLLASLVLLDAGYLSTLLTAFEQHFHADPARYGQSFAELIENGNEAQWLLTAVTAMQSHSAVAGWVLRRADRLRQRCAALGLDALELDRALADYDVGRTAASPVAARLGSHERPLHRLIAEMDPVAARVLVYQVQRVHGEAGS